MKQRFGLLDVISSVDQIRASCVGLRLTNFYDVDKKTYLLRFGGAESKIIVLIEYGIRIHMTNYTWTKNVFPSQFSMKCRKTLGNRRLTSVETLGSDRIIDFQFGTENTASHLIVELYDKGNLILTDNLFIIVHACRQRKTNDQNNTAVQQKYDFSRIRSLPNLVNIDEFRQIIATCQPKTSIKKILTQNFNTYGSQLIEHCLIKNNFTAKSAIGNGFESEKDFDRLYDAIKLADQLLSQFLTDSLKTGYIIMKEDSDSIHDEYHSFIFEQFKNRKYREYPSFCEAVDEFYSQIEQQKTEAKLNIRQRLAASKVENVVKDHQTRLAALEVEQGVLFITAELIQLHHERVNDIIIMINTALSNKLSWDEINHLLADSKSTGHELASIVNYTKFELNQVAVYLTDKTNTKHSVILDLSMTAFENSNKYYIQRRFALDKIIRIEASHNKALSSAQKCMKQVLKENAVQIKVKRARKPLWFEKFRWFISSENYLILAGKDAQENELLVKRYAKKYDIFMHAELYGASAVIIKIPKNLYRGEDQQPVSITTLHEAAAFAVCFSSAWESHITVPAYWVRMSQVSKTAPSGEFLKVGGFMIRGTKNFLPVPTLILGIGIMFKIDPLTLDQHLSDRVPKISTDLSDSFSTTNNGSIPIPNAPLKSVDIKNIPKIIDSESDSDIPQTNTLIDKAIQKTILKSTPVSTTTITEETIKSKELQPKQIVTKKSDILKRGQRFRKICKNTKYKDQDDEDRDLANKLLHVSLKAQTSKKAKKKLKLEETQKRLIEFKPNQNKPKITKEPKLTEIEADASDDEGLELETNLLSSFVSNPFAEDQLLYALLVCAPYSTLLPYKYKIKLTPGITKRGRAVKTALGMFSAAKDTSEMEKLLINCLKDVDNTRNMPTLVKVSAPNMIMNKKKT